MIFKYILMFSNFMQVQEIYRSCKVSYFQHVQRIANDLFKFWFRENLYREVWFKSHFG
jgi:hypothetical protein